jgi:4-alpha-glucanotransferase
VDVRSAARERGIATGFHDARGEYYDVAPGVLQRLVEALPAPAPRRYFPSTIVIRRDPSELDRDHEIVLAATAADFSWVLAQDTRVIARGEVNDTSLHLAGDVLKVGTYGLELRDATGAAIETAVVLVAPTRAFTGYFNRRWLLTTQLYSLASDRNWGVGDFTDLANLIRIAAAQGCAGIGLNPLHALFEDDATGSPYAPNSRLFLNPLYIDVEAMPEFDGTWRQRIEGEIAAQKGAPLIDYRMVTSLKMSALQRAFEAFQRNATAERTASFDRFRQQRGPLLRQFASFEAARHTFSGPWWDWPGAWRDPVRIPHGTIDESFASRIEFIEFQQWCADEQLRGCADLAASLGMPIGLYLDVAVGVRSGGFDAWLEQAVLARDLSVGAPPDLLNTAGQDWGLAGFNPVGLEGRAFGPFREMMRASFRYAGAVRLDHVLGLQRVYMIPNGLGAHCGSYVAMPIDALLAVIAQESHAACAVVIGEDLGTVPDGFRDKMADWGLFSYRVMLFERGGDGAFLSADAYSANALATFSTHDLPTFEGWRRSHDLAAKQRLGIDPGETQDARSFARRMFVERLRSDGIEDDGFPAVVEFLSRSPSRLLAVALEDILGVTEQVNIPGTVDEYPNWRRRLRVNFGQLADKFESRLGCVLASRAH